MEGGWSRILHGHGGKTVILFFPPKSSEKSLERFKQNSGLTHVNISKKVFWLPF